MNEVILTGRPTSDPIMKVSKSGKDFCFFTLAVNRYKGETDFIPIKAYDKTAKLLADYAHKGKLIGIIGSLHITKIGDGQKQQNWTEVVVNSVELLGSKNEGQQEQPVMPPNPFGQFDPFSD